MAFLANPLSLSVPEPAFESWLRETGYLEIIDDRATATATDPSSSSPPLRHRRSPAPASVATTAAAVPCAFVRAARTISAVLTLNPFAKLAADDLAGPTAPWTAAFLGPAGSYAWPAGPAQARMRAHENVRRYARNYAALAVLFFACSLYRMPVALLGLVGSLGLWELTRLCSDRWEMEQWHPLLRQALVCLVQIAAFVVLYMCQIQIALACAAGVSYIVMLLHASLRKLSSLKHLNIARGTKSMKFSIKMK